MSPSDRAADHGKRSKNRAAQATQKHVSVAVARSPPAKGPSKKNRRTLAYILHFITWQIPKLGIQCRGTNQPQTFFLRFVLVRFWAFLGDGSSKTP
jgi:hypothetical protein